MGFNCGIVGLPNVGKSTLFNAITQTSAAQAMNYPFCTIEPNIGSVCVNDPRLDKLAKLAKSEKIIPTHIELVDIAGLVKGASDGEGLGNQFLGHIRSTDAVLHIVRCFDDTNITHVNGRVDPIDDINIVETELLLADIQTVKKRYANVSKKTSNEFSFEKSLLEKVIDHLEKGNLAKSFPFSDVEVNAIRDLNLITIKPVIYVCNVDEQHVKTGNKWSESVVKFAKRSGSEVVMISAAIESEIALIGDVDEKQEYIKSIGLNESGLDRVVKAGYDILNLITFFTIGPKEAHAWTITDKSLAPDAAGVIHTDFKRGFICAETIGYQDYITCGGEVAAKNSGKMRLEGKEYVVKDGDIFHFRFNV